jgi:hypothetical protein
MNKPQVTRAQLERVIGRLFDEIQATKKSVASVQRAQDTKHTVLLPGESIKQLGEDGRVVAEIGGNDGSVVKHVDGPTPNQPEQPEVEVQDGQFTVIVDGYDVQGEPAPQDLVRTIVHYSREDGFTAYQGTSKGTISGASGQKVFGVSAGTWYVRVQWETLAGKLSEASEQVMVDVEPPVEQVDLEAVNQRIDDTDDYAQQQYQKYDTAHAEHTTAIESAQSDIADAHERIDVTDATATAAQQDATRAVEEATAAAAAAVEANNRALTRLYNGNFDYELDGWETDNVTISTEAHSGLYAARFENASWMWAATALPVRPGQIWELSLFTNGTADRMGIDIWVEDEYGEYLETFQHFNLNPTGEWADSGGLRFEIPEGAGFLNFTMSLWQQEDSVWLVDDIVLRDVTDVVRLEEAANENRRKAQDAIDEAAALRTLLEGEDGIQDRLDTALTGPVDHDRLRVGEGAFDELFAQEIVTGVIGAKKAAVIELIAQDLIAGNATLINAAMQNLSVSERADFVAAFAQQLYAEEFTARSAVISNLIVAARNLIPNGDLTQGDLNWSLGNAEIVTDDTPPGYEHAIRREPNDGSVSHDQAFPVQGGEEYVFEMWIKADKPGSMFFWDMRDQDGTHVGQTAGGKPSEAIEPETGHNPAWRPVSSFWVPTEWTRIRSALFPGPSVTSLQMRRMYFNHTNGDVHDATVSIGGVRLQARTAGHLVVPGTIDTRHLNVTEDMAATIARFGKAMADQFFANQAFIDRMAASEAYFGSEDADQQTRVDGTGIQLYERTADGEFIPAVIMGGGDFSLTFLENGETTGTLNRAGDAGLRSVNAQEYQLQGVDFVGSITHEDDAPILDSLTHKFVARNHRTLTTNDGANEQHYGFLPLSFHAVAGVTYEIHVPGFRLWPQSTGHPKYAQIHYTTDGTQPVLSSPILGNDVLGGNYGSNDAYFPDFTRYYHCQADCEVNLLLAVQASDPVSRWWHTTRDVEMTVRPAGITPPTTGETRDITPSNPDLGDHVQTYWTAWQPGWLRIYDHGGTYTGISTKINVGDTRDGRYLETMIGGYRSTPAMAGEHGEYLSVAVNGARITRGTLTVTGTSNPTATQGAMTVYWHTNTTPPDRFPTPSSGHLVGTMTVAAGQQSVLNLPQTCLNDIDAGNFRGFSFVHVDQPYVSAHGLNAPRSTQQPLLRLQYVR